MSDEHDMSRLQMIEADLSLCTREAKQIALERIAALEAQIARLTAVISPADLRDFEAAWAADAASGGDGTLAALTAFLERRMKG